MYKKFTEGLQKGGTKSRPTMKRPSMLPPPTIPKGSEIKEKAMLKKCSFCNNTSEIGYNKNVLSDVLDELNYSLWEKINKTIPFTCKHCTRIYFPYRAIRDIALVFPIPIPEMIGSIILPKSVINNYVTEYGVVLSIGNGFWDREKFNHTSVKSGDIVVFDKDIPFEISELWEGKSYIVKIMGERDIKGIVEGDENVR